MKVNNNEMMNVGDVICPKSWAYHMYKRIKKDNGIDWEMFKEVIELSNPPSPAYLDALDKIGHISDNPSIQLAAIYKQMEINNGTYEEVHNVFDDIKTAIKSIFRR
jgi:hypothetical protein